MKNIKETVADYNEEAFKRLQMIRFLDDWAYQANLRQEMKKTAKRPNMIRLKILMLKVHN